MRSQGQTRRGGAWCLNGGGVCLEASPCAPRGKLWAADLGPINNFEPRHRQTRNRLGRAKPTYRPQPLHRITSVSASMTLMRCALALIRITELVRISPDRLNVLMPSSQATFHFGLDWKGGTSGQRSKPSRSIRHRAGHGRAPSRDYGSLAAERTLMRTESSMAQTLACC